MAGSKSEAVEIKEKIADFLSEQLHLELNQEKTLVTNARNEKAHFLGYEIHILHADDKHDHRGQRCINGSVGLRIPRTIKQTHCAKYMRRGKPIHLTSRINNDAYSIVAQYQAEYRGVVQYYRMAYNLHTLNGLKWVMQLSLIKTLAKKFKTTCRQIYHRYKATISTTEGTFQVLQVVKPREPQAPLITHFGGVSLKWNKWVAIDDEQQSHIWNGRSEVVQRLLAQECELCGSRSNIEVHHIRKLADLEPKSRKPRPQWMKKMSARRRKTLVVCRSCHQNIQYGRYDGQALKRKEYGQAT